ncbi:MAG: hypothetical protein ACT4QG_12155 [Sporichthyaceae bacterium]
MLRSAEAARTWKRPPEQYWPAGPPYTEMSAGVQSPTQSVPYSPSVNGASVRPKVTLPRALPSPVTRR